MAYSSAERSANARKQLRDRKGRWIEMGGHVRFALGASYVSGTVQDINEEDGTITVKETVTGIVHRNVGAKQTEVIQAKATLPTSGQDDKPVAAPEAAPGVNEGEVPEGESSTEDTPSAEIDEDEEGGYKSELTEPVYDRVTQFASFENLDALQHYIDTGYNEMNSALRDGGPVDDTLAQRLGALSDLTRSFQLSEDSTVYRYISPDFRRGREFADSLAPGAIVEDKGFVSTSFDRDIAVDRPEDSDHPGALIVIDLPAGTRGAEVNPIIDRETGFKPKLDEQEFILPNGTKIEITERTVDETGLPVFRARLVSQELDDPTADTISYSRMEEAVQRYMFDGYMGVNDSLRGLDYEPTPELHGDIAALDRVMGESELSQDRTVYRGIHADPALPGSEQFVDSIVPDAVINDKGFLSTSSNPDTAREFAAPSKQDPSEVKGVVFEIQTRKGDRGLDTDSFAAAFINDENEVVLPRGISWRVVSVEDDKDLPGLKHAVLERVEDENSDRERDSAEEADRSGDEQAAPAGSSDVDSGTGDGDAADGGDRGDRGDSDRDPRELTDDELDAEILDLELEEDVLREEDGDKQEIRDLQQRRKELQRERAERSRDAADSGSDRDRQGDSDRDLPSPDAPGTGDGDDESSTPSDDASEEPQEEEAAEEDESAVDEAEDAAKKSRRHRIPNPDFPSPNRHSLPRAYPPNINIPNQRPGPLGEPEKEREAVVPPEPTPIDVLEISELPSGSTVYLTDPLNGDEDVTEFRREGDDWVGSNEYDDLELTSEELQDYVESRDPRDLTARRPDQEETNTQARVSEGDTAVFSVSGYDAVGTVGAVDTDNGTAEVTVGEQTVEVPLDSLQPVDDVEQAYTTPPGAAVLDVPAAAGDGELSLEEQYAYDQARARVVSLRPLARLAQEVDPSSAAGFQQELDALSAVVDRLHNRAVESFAQTMQQTTAAEADGPVSDQYPLAPDTSVTVSLANRDDREAAADTFAELSDAQVSAINADLRAGYADDFARELQGYILDQTLAQDTTLFRSEYVSLDVAQQMLPGRILRNESFMATHKSSEAVDEYRDRTTEDTDADGRILVRFRIAADMGAAAADLSDRTGHEEEVLLPAGVELEVTDSAWDPEREELVVTAAYDGTSVASVADMEALEENSLRAEETTRVDLLAALSSTIEETNRHGVDVALAELQGVDPDEEDERELARASAVRDAVLALLDTLPPAEQDSEAVAPSDEVRDVSTPEAAAGLQDTITGDDEASDVMRSALAAVSETPGVEALVLPGGDGTVAAVASLYENEEYLWIGHLAGVSPEATKAVLDSAVEEAGERRVGILLEPTPDGEAFWTQEQGFAQDPFGNRVSANGLTPGQVETRLEQGHPTAAPTVPYSVGFPRDILSPEQAETWAPGQEIELAQQLQSAPVGSVVTLGTDDAAPESYRKTAADQWAFDGAGAEEPLTSAELFQRSLDVDGTLVVGEAGGVSAPSEGVQTETTVDSLDSEGVQVKSGDLVVRIAQNEQAVVTNVTDSGLYLSRPDGSEIGGPFPADSVRVVETPEPSSDSREDAFPQTPQSSRQIDDTEDRDRNGELTISDSSGLTLYPGSEVSDSITFEYVGNIVSIEEDGVHVRVQDENGKTIRKKAEDLDLTITIAITLEDE